MCAIVDNNVASEVFGRNPPAAGKHFRRWLGGRNGRLAVGGRLLEELRGNSDFREWFQQNELSGQLLQVSAEEVDQQERRIKRTGLCASDDEHVLALALVSGARLIYTNDAALIADFKNRGIVANPRGKVYSTVENNEVTSAHRRLLADRTLCRAA